MATHATGLDPVENDAVDVYGSRFNLGRMVLTHARAAGSDPVTIILEISTSQQMICELKMFVQAPDPIQYGEAGN